MNTTLTDVSADLSAYLRRDDVRASGPRRLRIAAVARETFEAKGTRPANTKIVLTFMGPVPVKLSLNKTNLKTCASAFGTNAQTWIGKDIIVAFNPDVEFAGETIGGLRLRVPTPKPAAAPAPPTPAEPDPDVVISDDDLVAMGLGADTVIE